MGIEGYTSPIDPIEKSAELDEQWQKDNEEGIKELSSTDIKDYLIKNYDLAGELIEKHLGKFLKKQNITNGLMVCIDEYEEELLKIHSQPTNNDKKFLEDEESLLESSLIRTFTNNDIDISDQEEDEFQDGIDGFMKELKQKLLEKHGLTDLGNNK